MIDGLVDVLVDVDDALVLLQFGHLDDIRRNLIINIIDIRGLLDVQS